MVAADLRRKGATRRILSSREVPCPIKLKPRSAVLAMALAAAGPASAGAISGMLTKPGNKPLGVAYAKLVCGSAESATKSYALGNYSLAIAASGLCTVSVGSG